MGATFITRYIDRDEDAGNAFRRMLHEEYARLPEPQEMDHYNYSGTPMEWSEHGFEIAIITPMTLEEAQQTFHCDSFDAHDGEPCGKWGPAGAVPIKPHGWFFYGWVSE
jgi:hypothetical protein